MTLLLEKPTTGEHDLEEFEGEYIFFIDKSIVGRVEADCWVCSWKQGYAEWPRSTMALSYIYTPHDLTRRCQVQSHGPDVRWVFFRENTIVGELMENCFFRALQAGLPQWPGSGIAIVVHTEPADIHLECRIKRRERQGR